MINCNRHFKNSIAIATPFPGVGFTWGFLHREGTDRIFMFYMPRIADYCTNCPSILFPSKYWTVNFFCTLHVRNFQRRICHCVSVRQAICNAWQIGNWVSPTTFGLRSWVGHHRFTYFTNLPNKKRLQYSSEVAAARQLKTPCCVNTHFMCTVYTYTPSWGGCRLLSWHCFGLTNLTKLFSII